MQEMNAHGPVWMSVKDMNDMLCGKSEKEQECLLKVQLRYRKKVLKDEHAKKGVLNLSSGGKLLSVKQMKENMKQVPVYGRPKGPKLINLKIDINKINKRQHRMKLTDIHKIKNKSREIQQQFFPN